MAALPQQQSTPGDHHYFEWSTTKQQKLVPIGVNQQQTNLVHNHPLMTHTHRRHYYEEKCLVEDNKIKPNKLTNEIIPSPPLTNNDHTRKKQKTNGIGSSSNSNSDQNQTTCYPFQAELTQKIDFECGSNNTNSGQTAHTPTHHFTLSTVINVSVNGQTPQSQKSFDILPSPSQQQYPITSNDQPSFPSLLSTVSPTTNPSLLIPFADLNLPIYLKDIDLTTLDTLILPICPNPQDYLTIDGLLTFLMSDNNLKSSDFNKRNQQISRPISQQYRMEQMYNYPRAFYRYPYPTNNQQYQMSQHFNYAPLQQNSSSMIMSGTGASLSSIQQSSIQNSHPSSIITETGNSYPSSYYRQTSLPNYSTSLQQ